MSISERTFLVLLVLLVLATLTDAATQQFDKFLPNWDPVIQSILQDNCTEQLAAYRTGEVNTTLGLSSLVTPVINCILTNTPEFRKVEMAASAVVLGLTPSILQPLASTTGELALLSLRRPILAFLLGAGSPIVSPTRLMEFEDPAKLLMGQRRKRLAGGSFPQRWFLISAIQYVLACGCIANVGILAYELGVHAAVMFSPESVYLVALWSALVAVAHAGWFLGLRLRVRVFGEGSVVEPGVLAFTGQQAPKRPAMLPDWIRDEVMPSAYNRCVSFDYSHDTGLFKALSRVVLWLVSVGHVFLVLYGTLVCSSLLFFSVIDSLVIVSRYFLSAVICRLIFLYELAGMEAIPVESQESKGG